jgi:CBS domain containing-hemolysin-like protein
MTTKNNYAGYKPLKLAGYHLIMSAYGVIFVYWLLMVLTKNVQHASATLLVISILAAAFVFFLLAAILPKLLFKEKPDAILNINAVQLDAEHEIKIIQNALDFSTVKLRDCMIPRTDIAAVEENTTIAELKQKFIDTGISKIIVYRDDIDNVTGYVHSKELFKNPQSLKAMINPLTFVPETMSGNRMMQLFIQEHRSIAIVVDEYGGTSGLLTLEDLIEEIFGEIEDEHDRDNLVERQISEHEYLFSGRLEIEYLRETFHLDIPQKDDYDTLAGFILYHHLNLPPAGETIYIEPYTFVIRKVTNTRIDLVQMTVNS